MTWISYAEESRIQKEVLMEFLYEKCGVPEDDIPEKCPKLVDVYYKESVKNLSVHLEIHGEPIFIEISKVEYVDFYENNLQWILSYYDGGCTWIDMKEKGEQWV